MKLLALLPLLAALSLLQDGSTDPEATEAGRREYLGRDIARTMHWSGAGWLTRDSREEEEAPARLLRWLDLEPGETACDFGCGNGYHTLPMAEAVGAEGEVLAVDLQPEMLELLEVRARAAGLGNVRPVQGSVRDTGLPAASCDLVLLVDVYHELSHPVTTLRGLRDALRPGGELVLVEFRAEDPEVPIKPDHKMSEAQVVLEMAANGLSFSRLLEGLPWQHALAFRRDPDFPRESGQARAEGEAVARGLARALARGDLLAVSGYLGRRVEVGGESTRSRDWLAGWSEHLEELGEEAWRAHHGGLALAIEGVPGPDEESASSDDRLTLVLGTGPDALRFELEREPDGRWRVAAAPAAPRLAGR